MFQCLPRQNFYVVLHVCKSLCYSSCDRNEVVGQKLLVTSATLVVTGALLVGASEVAFSEAFVLSEETKQKRRLGAHLGSRRCWGVSQQTSDGRSKIIAILGEACKLLN